MQVYKAKMYYRMTVGWVHFIVTSLIISCSIIIAFYASAWSFQNFKCTEITKMHICGRNPFKMEKLGCNKMLFRRSHKIRDMYYIPTPFTVKFWLTFLFISSDTKTYMKIFCDNNVWSVYTYWMENLFKIFKYKYLHKHFLNYYAVRNSSGLPNCIFRRDVSGTKSSNHE